VLYLADLDPQDQRHRRHLHGWQGRDRRCLFRRLLHHLVQVDLCRLKGPNHLQRRKERANHLPQDLL
jgi:hypothetical protein